MPLLSRPPAVSIVTATYNRSRALVCAIESVRRQSFEDWELIVVGDACTDDTVSAVARIGDSRIRMLNLQRNFGEQAGPNNVGIADARAPLVAFLNHDDLWFPHHLAFSRETLLGESADLVFGMVANLQTDTPMPLDPARLHMVLEGHFPSQTYDPGEMDAGFVPATSWMVRTDVLTRLGGWRLGRHCVVEPSQDLLFRAWRAGCRLRALNVPTAITVNSGTRPGSYVGGAATEQEWFLERLSTPGFAAIVASKGEVASSTRLRPAAWKRAMANAVARCGINPRELKFRMRRGLKRGDWIAHLRQVRGLPVRHGADTPEDWWTELVRLSCCVREGSVVDFTAGGNGIGCLVAGWAQPEDHGVWNNGRHASLFLSFDRAIAHDVELVLTVRAFWGTGSAVREVEVSLDDQSLAVWEIRSEEDVHERRVTIPAAATQAPIWLRFTFANPESPRDLGLSDDPRQLAMSLRGLRVHASA